MRALVLSGGGGRGAYEIGVWKALHERGVDPDLVSGTSVGAFAAAFIAADLDPSAVAELWVRLQRSEVFRIRRDVWNFGEWTHLLDPQPLRTLLEERLDLEAVRTSDTTVLVTAVSIEEGELHVFRNEDLTVDHLLASAALPFVFPMVEVDGRTYWDGGLAGMTPLEPAILEGAREVHVVLPHPYGSEGSVPTSPVETLERAFEVSATTRLRQDVRRVRRINRLVEQGTAGPSWHRIDLHVISPSRSLDARVLTVDGETTREMVEIGYRDGLAALRGDDVGDDEGVPDEPGTNDDPEPGDG